MKEGGAAAKAREGNARKGRGERRIKLTSVCEKRKQGMCPMLKKRLPTMSAAAVPAIFRQDRNLQACKSSPNAEFMNVQFLEILRVLILQVYLWGGGGGGCKTF